MRFISCFSAAVLLLLGVAASPAGERGAQANTPRGQWVTTHRAYTPSDALATTADTLTGLGYQVNIKSGSISAMDSDKVGYVLQATFDPTQSPMAVDLQLPGEGNPVMHGIYKQASGILSIAVGTGDTRPTIFANADNTFPANQILLVLIKAPKGGTD